MSFVIGEKPARFKASNDDNPVDCIYLGGHGDKPLRGPFAGNVIAFPKASPHAPFASAAALLFALGYGPMPESREKIPCFAKGSPLAPWTSYYLRAQRTPDEIRELIAAYPKAQLGAVCGYRNLLAVDIDIDTDDQDKINTILHTLPAWTIAKRGSKGLTIFFRYDGDPDDICNRAFYLKEADGAKGGAFCEVLWTGRKTTIPPSIHAKLGKPYLWIDPEHTLFNTRVEDLPEITTAGLDALEAAIKAWTYRPPARPEAGLGKPLDYKPAEIEAKRFRAYAQAALDGRAKDLSGAAKGARNRALFDAVCTLGKYVHHGHLDRADMVRALVASCNHNGLEKSDGLHSVMETIKSGLWFSRNDPLYELKDRPRPSASRKASSSRKPRGLGARQTPDPDPDDAPQDDATAPGGGGNGSDGGIGAATGHGPQPGSNRPIIRITGGSLSDNADDAEQMLRAAGIDVYQQRGKLVRPKRIKMRDSKRKEVEVPAIIEVSVTFMRDLCCRHIEWLKWDTRKSGNDKWVKTDPPKAVAETIIERKGDDPRWQTLAGVTGTPFLRRDGSIARKPGYDDATGMFLMDPVVLPLDMPERPTKQDAERALAILEDLLLDFPFVDPHDEPKFESEEEAKDRRRKTVSFSVALSELLTPIARAAIAFAPLHVKRAPVAGSGKSYLSDIMSAIANGTACAVIAAGKDEEETEKRVASELLAGIQIVNIDNVNGVLSGSLICQAISQETVAPRRLQKSETPRITNVFMILANGNNIRVAGDLTRRTLWCVLDAWLDATKVQERTFTSNPVAKVLADRGKYIAACLTILRAHHLAGYPCKNTDDPNVKELTALVNFDDWTRVVRGALVWLGKTDPVKSLDVGRAQDPQRNERQFFVEALYDMNVVSENTALTIAQMSEKFPTHPELKEALQDFIDPKGVLNTKKVSQWFYKFLEEPFGRKRLKSASAGKGRQKYYVDEMPNF